MKGVDAHSYVGNHMRTRDSAHEAELKQIAALPEEQLLRRIQLDHTEVGHVPSEVLATIVRTHFGRAAGVTSAAVATLNRRIQLIVGKRWQGAKDRPEVERRGGQAFTDASTTGNLLMTRSRPIRGRCTPRGFRLRPGARHGELGSAEHKYLPRGDGIKFLRCPHS